MTVDGRGGESGFERVDWPQTRLLHWCMFAGLALYAIVAAVVLTQGYFAGVFSPDPITRSAAALFVGLGSFIGLKVSRGAHQTPRSLDEPDAEAFQRTRFILGWAVIEGSAFGGICFGLLAGNARLVLILAGMGLAAMFLARPDLARLEAGMRRAR